MGLWRMELTHKYEVYGDGVMGVLAFGKESIRVIDYHAVDLFC